MPDRGVSIQGGPGPSFGRDSVYIDTNRILDSCRDKDCAENMPVYLTDFGQDVIEKGGSVKAKEAKIIGAKIVVDDVPFNRGFYQVDIRIFVKVTCEVCTGVGRSQEICGIAVFEKHVILFGSEGDVSVYRSDPSENGFCHAAELNDNGSNNLPTAVLETVDPVVLGIRIAEPRREPPRGDTVCLCESDIPESVRCLVEGPLCFEERGKRLLVSLGFFSIVRIERPAQLMISGCEYSVPEKECVVADEDDPCSIFRRMAFPVDAFSLPQSPARQNPGKCCGNR